MRDLNGQAASAANIDCSCPVSFVAHDENIFLWMMFTFRLLVFPCTLQLVVVSRRDQSCLWEQGDNRKLQINPPDAQHCTIVDVNCTWNKNEGGEIKATHLPPAKVSPVGLAAADA